MKALNVRSMREVSADFRNALFEVFKAKYGETIALFYMEQGVYVVETNSFHTFYMGSRAYYLNPDLTINTLKAS